jgi:hypothetical protein
MQHTIFKYPTNTRLHAMPEVKEMSAGLEEIAQAVAVAVEDKALRERIYEKSMEKFDGVSNVLWKTLDAEKSFGRGLSAALVDKNV